MLRVAILLFAASIALTAYNLRSILPDVPTAEQAPDDCLSEFTAATVWAFAPGTVVPLVPGREVGFRVGAGLPADDVGVACSLSRADVYLQLPGERGFKRICRLETIAEGERHFCPERIPYVADPADMTDGVIVARVRVIADVADDAFPCTVPSNKRNPRLVSNCVDATGLTVLGPVVEP